MTSPDSLAFRCPVCGEEVTFTSTTTRGTQGEYVYTTWDGPTPVTTHYRLSDPQAHMQVHLDKLKETS